MCLLADPPADKQFQLHPKISAIRYGGPTKEELVKADLDASLVLRDSSKDDEVEIEVVEEKEGK